MKLYQIRFPPDRKEKSKLIIYFLFLFLIGWFTINILNEPQVVLSEPIDFKSILFSIIGLLLLAAAFEDWAKSKYLSIKLMGDILFLIGFLFLLVLGTFFPYRWFFLICAALFFASVSANIASIFFKHQKIENSSKGLQ